MLCSLAKRARNAANLRRPRSVRLGRSRSTLSCIPWHSMPHPYSYDPPVSTTTSVARWMHDQGDGRSTRQRRWYCLAVCACIGLVAAEASSSAASSCTSRVSRA